MDSGDGIWIYDNLLKIRKIQPDWSMEPPGIYSIDIYYSGRLMIINTLCFEEHERDLKLLTELLK